VAGLLCRRAARDQIRKFAHVARGLYFTRAEANVELLLGG
jgi:hypothetical protein